MKRIAIAIVTLVLAVVALAGVFLINGRVNEPYRGYSTPDQLIEIPSGIGPNEIGRRLIAGGVVRDQLTFRIALWLTGSARHLQAGEYRFDKPMSARDVIGKVARGEVDLLSVTFPEGLSIAEMSKIFESSGLGTAAEFAEAARNAALVRAEDPAAADLEGYLFPDTYAVPRRADAALVVRVMVDGFHRVLTPELRAAGEQRNLTVRQLVT